MRPSQTALAFHGEFHRRLPKCADYFAVESNLRSHLLDPLEAGGVSIWTYISTVTSGDAATDQLLLSSLKPRAHEILPRRLPMIVSSYINVLRLVLSDDPSAISTVILTRPDIFYVKPITSIGIVWQHTNYLFRDGPVDHWKKCNMTSDIFMALPLAHVSPLLTAITWSGNISRHGPNNYCVHGGSAHFTYTMLSQMVGIHRIRFLSEQFCSSRSHEPRCRSLMYINRSCPAH